MAAIVVVEAVVMRKAIAAGMLTVIVVGLSGCGLIGLPPVVGVTLEHSMPTVVLACGGDVSVYRNEVGDPWGSPLIQWSVEAPKPVTRAIDIQIFTVPPGWQDRSVLTTADFPPTVASGPPQIQVVRLDALAPGTHYTTSSGSYGEAPAPPQVTFTLADLKGLDASHVLVGDGNFRNRTPHLESRQQFLADAADECRNSG